MNNVHRSSSFKDHLSSFQVASLIVCFVASSLYLSSFVSFHLSFSSLDILIVQGSSLIRSSIFVVQGCISHLLEVHLSSFDLSSRFVAYLISRSISHPFFDQGSSLSRSRLHLSSFVSLQSLDIFIVQGSFLIRSSIFVVQSCISHLVSLHLSFSSLVLFIVQGSSLIICFVAFSRFMSHLSSFSSLIVCFVDHWISSSFKVHLSSFVSLHSRGSCLISHRLFRSRGSCLISHRLFRCFVLESFVSFSRFMSHLSSFVSLFRSRGFVARCFVLEVSLQQLYKQTYN